MTKSGFRKTCFIMAFSVLMLSLASSTTLYAGVVSETDVSRSVISERWLGVSGNVERGNSSLQGFKTGILSLNNSLSGQVLEAGLEGIRGGGYYIVFLPGNISLEPENLGNVSKEDLYSDGIFSEEIFPKFYPEYSQKFDKPSKTFQEWRKIKVNGRTYNSSITDLSGSADMHLLKYDNGSRELPAFVSPIDGSTRGSSFESCYAADCNFQALLPNMGGQNSYYSINLISKGNALRGCGEVEGNTSLVTGNIEGSDCININEPNSYVDFYNAEVQSSNGCAVKSETSNVTLTDLSVNNSATGLCLEGTNIEVLQSSIEESDVAVSSQGSNISLNSVQLEGNALDVALQGSTGLFQNVSFEGARFYGAADSVNIQSYTDPLPAPSDLSEDMTPLKMRIEIQSNSNNSYIENFGFGYPDINTSSILPESIYKYDISGETVNTTELPTDLIEKGDERFARYSGEVRNFSIFSLYGKNIEGNQSSPGEGEDEEVNSGGSSGSGSGSTGSAGGGLSGAADVTPEPVIMNLSVEQKLYNVKRGDTLSVGFELNNTGDVAADVSVDISSEWTSVPRNFDAIEPGEVRSGVVLSTVPEDISIGNHTFQVFSEYEGATLDEEEITVNVSQVVDTRRLDVMESPPFLNIGPSESHSVAIQVENPTPRPIRDIKASFRGDSRCAITGNRTYSVPAETTKSIAIDIETKEDAEVCNDALVLKADSEILGYAPMRIEVEETSEMLISVPVYLMLLFLWTAALLYRLKTRKNGEKFRW